MDQNSRDQNEPEVIDITEKRRIHRKAHRLHRRRPRSNASSRSADTLLSPIVIAGESDVQSSRTVISGDSIICLSSDDEATTSAHKKEVIIDLTSPHLDDLPNAPNATNSDLDLPTLRGARRKRQSTENEVIVIEKKKTQENDIRNSSAHEDEGDSLTPKRKLISCPICMDHERTIRRTGRQLVSTKCGHIYCNQCITQAISTSKCCPTCRKKLVVKGGFHPIFL